MRLNNILIAFVAVLAGLSSCMKENMPLQDGQVRFSAGFEDSPSTKTVLEGMTPYWNQDDMISVYDGENNMFRNTVTGKSAKATFTGKLAGKGRKYYLAAYPYSSELSFAFLSKTVYGIYMPVEQEAVVGSYDPSAAPAIAYTEDFTLSFRNVSSLIKFRIISEGVKSVTVRSNAGESLAGRFNATWGNSPRVTVTAGEKTVTIKGDFEKDQTYYISTIPNVLTEGITVTLNGDVVTMVETYQIDLARSGMVNLGDLSLDPSESQKPSVPDQGEDEAVPSSWKLLGEHNGWNAEEGTPMYEVGNNFVAYDVPASAAAGFKFNNGDVWVGTNVPATVNEWVRALVAGGGNISFTASADVLYDIYFANTLSAFYFTPAGSPAPGPAPMPFVGMAVAGTFNSWSPSANPVVEEGDHYVLRGIKAAMVNSLDPSDKGFKFVDSEEGGTLKWYGAASASVAVSKWHAVNSDGSAANIYVSGDASADFDVYMTKDLKSFCVVPAGGELPSLDVVDPAPDPKPDQGGKVIYLDAGGDMLWGQADAWFEVWSWPTGAEGAWYTMTSAGSGIYQCTIPSGNDNIIFVRRGPDMVQGWDAGVHYWNKTDDIAIPSGMNCYTITGWGGAEGSWSVR